MPAAVISYDPSTDLAVLYVRGLQVSPLQFAAEPATIGDDGIVLGYPLDGPFTPTAAKIRDRIQLRGPNIYDSGEVTREVYTVRAVVRSGNSGGPIIRPDGKVMGVVFGAALDDSETGFVLTAAQVKPTLERAPTLTRPVDTGSCAA
jgi:S1-C subfamily serine protease